MSRLRILHVVPYFEHAWAYGGIPRLATAMARGLATRGHAVTVCTTDAGDAQRRAPARQAPTDGPAVRVFPNLSNTLAYRWQMFTPVGLHTFLRRHARDFDVAHVHACRNLPGVLAARHLGRAGVPFVLSPNGTAPLLERRIGAKRLFDALEGRRVLDGAARVIAVTEAERAQLRALGVDEHRIALVPNPVDEREFRELPGRTAFRRARGIPEGPLVLFLGKLTPRKGVDVLVRALPHVAARDTTIAIAGNDMGAAASIEHAVDELRLARRVRMIGLLRGRERLEALASADVVVYPSRDEIFGLVPVEALLCGTPVVVCDDSGCGEVIGQLGGGQAVPFGDPIRLARAIDSTLHSPDLWRARAQAAGARALQLFSSRAVCAQLETLYSAIRLPSPALSRAVH